MKPWRVSAMITRSVRTSRTLSSITAWTWRGSEPFRRAISSAWLPGVISRMSRSRPSALETTFWATTRMSPVGQLRPLRQQAREVVAGRDLGQPGDRVELDQPARRRSRNAARSDGSSTSSASSGES